MNGTDKPMTTIRSIMIPLALSLSMLLWGLMIFFLVGDKKPMPWFYGSQRDVPGQSPYSTHRAKLFPGSAPQPFVEKIRPQHVDGSVTATQSPARIIKEIQNGD